MTSTVVQDKSDIAPRDFVIRLAQLAGSRADDNALTVVSMKDAKRVESVFSYRQLWTDVQKLAAYLQQHFATGERALLMLDNDEHYVISLFACFAAGIIAVPIFPPESNRPQHLSRLNGVVEDAKASIILSSSAFMPVVSEAARQFGIDHVLAVDCLPDEEHLVWQTYQPPLESIAFLQYTSGSTSSPKGVMVTHECLMANEAAIKEGLAITDKDCFAVWSPLFHDMGLIGGLLQPFYSGIACVLCSPRYFTASPLRWLRLIHDYRVSISGGPDFAYRLCIDRIKEAQCEGLDLSCWRVAYTGAEPVRSETMLSFINRFANYGFSAAAVYPCYGLAEATLFITGVTRGSGLTSQSFAAEDLARAEVRAEADQAILVGCGHVSSGHQVQIMHPQTLEPVASHQLGEIWASGPSIAAGYWRKPEQTHETFVTDASGQRWLRTGDLGFVYQDHLYIAGRLKDMIIVRGHNVYPHDIENLIEDEIDVVRKGRVAAFSVEINQQEGVGIAAEISRNMQKLIKPDAIVQLIAEVVSPQLGEAPKVVALLNVGAMPKTSSGKLQRQACRRQWQEKNLDAYAIFENGMPLKLTSGESEERQAEANAGSTSDATQLIPAITVAQAELQNVALLWAQVLSHKSSLNYMPESDFFVLGGNSLTAVDLASQIHQHYQIDFLPRHVFMYPKLATMTNFILSQQQSPQNPVIPTLTTEQRAQPQVLSNAQLRQWFLWQLDPDSTAYHIQGGLEIEGQLDVHALQTAIDQVVQRHLILRTQFLVQADGEVRQIINNEQLPRLEYYELNTVNGLTKQQIIQGLLQQAFDLTQGPLVRVALIQEAAFQHSLLLVLHHILADASSMQLLLNELGALYAVNLKQTDLPAEPILQYIDYAVWQSQQGNQGVPAEQMRYWQEKLGRDHPVLNLPYDFTKKDKTTSVAGYYRIDIPQPLSEKLRQKAEKLGTTPFVLLLSGFQSLLYRYTAQQEIRVGVPIANRNACHLEHVIGFFVNTLVLQQKITPRASLAQLIEQTRQAHQEAQANADVPFEQLVQVLQPERGVGMHPLFQVMFNYLHDDFSSFARHSGLNVKTIELKTEQAQFDLTLEVREHHQAPLTLCFIYDSNLFAINTIKQMARHYLSMINALVMHSEQQLDAVKLLNENEQYELALWGENRKSHGIPSAIHCLIEAQAVAQPEQTALIFNDSNLSYQALNQRSNQLAHYLIKQGVKPEDKVGVALERSFEMVVALLAILKAGAAYVPLDPEYPADRLAYMMADSGLELVLTQQHLQPQLPRLDTVHSVVLDQLNVQEESIDNPALAVHAENLAYVIYTSGSTGKPKGVAVRHRALSSCMRWMQEKYRLGAQDTVLHKAPFSFDVSCWEIFWPLSQGIKLVIAHPGDQRDPQRLLALIKHHKITTLNFVPLMLQAFLEQAEWFEDASTIKHIMCGGEAINASIQTLAINKLGGGVLQNLYGPTETTIHVTQWTCQDDGITPVPIGRPINETQTYVVDALLNIVPHGIAGELYIGGELLARGYLHRPELTADRFIADPFTQDGGRLYRTGDLVRWNTEGQLVYLGRVDHQVKIRGFRIELGEIEAQLLKQAQVREAIVVAQHAEPSDRLVAYVTLKANQESSDVELRQCLGQDLPDYMVPSAIVILDSLPLNTNGKIDRQALPLPDFSTIEAYEAPQNAIEEQIAKIWSELLGLDAISRHSNFFDIGGHSLLLIRLHQLIKDSLLPSITLLDLFTYPSIYTQALFIANQGTENTISTQQQDKRSARRKQAILQRQRPR